MITPERLQEIKDKWEVPREHTPFSSFERGLLETLDELIAALEAAQAELDDIKPWLIKYRESIFEDRATARELAKMLDWINANPNRKRAYELDTEVEE